MGIGLTRWVGCTMVESSQVSHKAFGAVFTFQRHFFLFRIIALMEANMEAVRNQ